MIGAMYAIPWWVLILAGLAIAPIVLFIVLGTGR
jgi:hypothetical protein